MRRFSFVYFDLDDTLLDHRRAEAAALVDLHGCTPALARVEIDDTRSAYRQVNGRVWREYAAGRRTKEQTRSGRFELLFERLDVDSDPVRAADAYLEAYADHWHLIDGAGQALEAVAKRYPVGLLTNGFAEAQRAKLRRFPDVAATFSTVVISEEEGVMKPQPGLFRVAEQRAGHGAGDILYIGDSLHSDIEGGLAAGWDVLWFNPRSVSGPQGVQGFDDWDALPKLIGL